MAASTRTAMTGGPANAVTITSGDLHRMRALADGGVALKAGASASEAATRAARKAASEARAAQWPNTLEALRRRKDQARKDAAAAHEASLVADDAASAAVREAERLAAIDAAKALVRQQTDKFKIVANYRARSYDMDVLAKQAALKAAAASARARADADEHARMLADLSAATEEDSRKLEAARAKARAQQEDQHRQIRAIIDRRIAALHETEEEGKRMLADIAARDAEATAAAYARRDAGAAAQRAFKEENVRLQAVRAEMKKSEAEMMTWIAAQAAAKEEQDAKIRAIIVRQREEAERKARVISDLMAADYAARKDTEDTRLATEVAAAEAKAANVAAAKARAQAEMRASIDEFIRASQKKALDAIRAQIAEDARAHEEFRAKLAAAEAAEAAAAAARRAASTAFKTEWLSEAAAKKRAKEEAAAKAKAEAAAEAAAALGGPEDAEFAAAVAALEAEEAAKGHAIQPLRRMVHGVLHPPLMSNLRR
jgi:hypothetical protein